MTKETVKNAELKANKEQLKDEDLEQASGGRWQEFATAACPECHSGDNVIKSQKVGYRYYCKKCRKHF